MLHHRTIALPRNADDIEAGVALVELFLVKKIPRRLDHLTLLARLHRFERRAEAMIRAGLHFDKDYHLAVKDDQVYFAGLAAIVALDQFIALFTEKFGGKILAFLTEALTKKTHGRFTPARNSTASPCTLPSKSRTGLKLRRWIGVGP